MIAINIDVTKLDKNHFFKGAKGTYADLTLHDNKDGVDQYGNAGFVSQGVSKEARASGERGPIIGNWKHIGQSSPQSRHAPVNRNIPSNRSQPSSGDDFDDVPFGRYEMPIGF